MLKIATCSILLLLFAFVSLQVTDPLPVDEFIPENGTTFTNKTSGDFKLTVHNLSLSEWRWIFKPNASKLKTNKTPAINFFLHKLFLHEDDRITLYRNEEDSLNDSLSIIPPIQANNGSITIVTEEKVLVIKLKGTDTSYLRTFEGEFKSIGGCTFTIPPDVYIMQSPIHSDSKTVDSLKCVYTYSKDPHYRAIPTFVFEQFNFSASNIVELKGTSHDGSYVNNPIVDIFPSQKTMSITVEMKLPTNETYRLRHQLVDESCSKYVLIKEGHTFETFMSPMEILNNGSIITECRWLFEHSNKSKVLSIDFKDLYFDSALDIISINDGASELSPPLLQVTTSNINHTMDQLIRSTGPYVWIAFKPVTYGSRISGQVTEHGEGGYFRRNGTIHVTPTVFNDTVFQLEVDSDQIVYLNFTETELNPPATLKIYNSFDKSNLLTTLHGKVWYPVLSQSSKMMIIATGFSTSKFTAQFSGVSPGCLHMSTISNENYILSGNCNASCLWVVPPQDRPGSVLLMNLQFLSLIEGDSIDIIKLDAAKTRIGSIYANVTHVPQLVIPADVGALVEINRAPCQKDNSDIVLVGHSSYVPACGRNLSLDALAEFQITSPLHPDTYPIFASCHWKISTPKENVVHLAFDAFKLAPNHCIKVFRSSDNVTEQYAGSQLPEDLFLSGDSTIQFDSSNCKTTKVTNILQSSEGFVLNGTIANCGGILDKQTSGEFSVPANKSLCIWKISVPDTNANDIVNIISYTISKKDDKGNYELHVYDGASIRESAIVNNSNSEIWSRTSNLIFVYKRIDVSKPSTILAVKYGTISCNETNQCDNKICLHPDWRCNGVNDCGDFSDERNCASVPIPPVIEHTGYTALAFWLTVLLMLATGVVFGMTAPYCYQKYKNGQYRRFGDISVIE